MEKLKGIKSSGMKKLQCQELQEQLTKHNVEIQEKQISVEPENNVMERE